MQSGKFDEKRDTLGPQAAQLHEDIHQGGAHEGGSLENRAQERTMGSGSARYLRYILFAFFVCLFSWIPLNPELLMSARVS